MKSHGKRGLFTVLDLIQQRFEEIGSLEGLYKIPGRIKSSKATENTFKRVLQPKPEHSARQRILCGDLTNIRGSWRSRFGLSIIPRYATFSCGF
ncbi:hypothetical protein TNCV_3882681 [Trichonephila clavipes]|nr:hypothetical protein TNCV_3882681 [Trichonephila clavipes]